MTHYPRAFFCPVCESIILREDSLIRHFVSKIDNCVGQPKAARFLLGRTPEGDVRRALDMQYFSIYFLGGMDDFPMPDEHFKIVAKRERGQLVPIL